RASRSADRRARGARASAVCRGRDRRRSRERSGSGDRVAERKGFVHRRCRRYEHCAVSRASVSRMADASPPLEHAPRAGMRVGVLNNRRAGGGGAQHGESATEVAQWLRTRSDVAHVEPDAGTIAEGLAELARREVEVLVVNGGDGTLQRILTILCTDSPFE